MLDVIISDLKSHPGFDEASASSDGFRLEDQPASLLPKGGWTLGVPDAQSVPQYGVLASLVRVAGKYKHFLSHGIVIQNNSDDYASML